MFDTNIFEENLFDTTTKAKRKYDSWQSGFTMVENRIFWQGVYLTSDAKVTYATLKSFENHDTKLCFPSYDKILERSGLTRPRLSNAIAELERFSWISKKKRFSGSTYYTLGTPVVYQNDEFGDRIGLNVDQTCPTKPQAVAWQKCLDGKKRRTKKSWSERVRAEGERIAREDAEWEEQEIPF